MSSINETPVNPITPEEVVRQLRALCEQIPDFSVQTRAEARRATPAATVSEELVHGAINAIAASPPVEQALGREANTLRAEHELIGRWSQVAVELEGMRTGVLGAIRKRRHRIGGIALRVYQVSRQLARYNENENLLPHIDVMRRAVRLKRRQPKEPVAPPQPIEK